MSGETFVYNKINVSGVTTVLTGGLYKFTDTYGNGIGTTTPSAFDSEGRLKPTGMVKGRDEMPSGALDDDEEQYTTTRQVVEVYLYDEKGATYEARLEPLVDTLYGLLHNKQLSDYSFVRWITKIRTRDAALEDALLIRVDFQIESSRGG